MTLRFQAILSLSPACRSTGARPLSRGAVPTLSLGFWQKALKRFNWTNVWVYHNIQPVLLKLLIGSKQLFHGVYLLLKKSVILKRKRHCIAVMICPILTQRRSDVITTICCLSDSFCFDRIRHFNIIYRPRPDTLQNGLCDYMSNKYASQSLQIMQTPIYFH